MNYIDELFKEITAWQRKTFPLSDALSRSKHLREEAGELVESLEQNKPLDEVKKEAADILILLFGVVSSLRYDFLDLVSWVEKKMEENKKRTWGAPDPDGVVRHVKEPVSDSRPITEPEVEERILRARKLEILSAQAERLNKILIRLKEKNDYSMEKAIRITLLLRKIRSDGFFLLSQPIRRYPFGSQEHPGGLAIIQESGPEVVHLGNGDRINLKESLQITPDGWEKLKASTSIIPHIDLSGSDPVPDQDDPTAKIDEGTPIDFIFQHIGTITGRQHDVLMKARKLEKYEMSRGAWIKKGSRKNPDPGSRIEIFSPIYERGDPMRVRIIDEQFLPTCKEATFWRNIIEP